MFRSYLLPLATAVALGGCSFSGDIARHAVEYNKTVEQAENEMLLLNIVRSSKGRPMHFTRIAEISSSLSGAASASLAQNGAAADNLTLGINGSVNPTFGLQILNSVEFFENFMKPISADVFQNFVGQGYSLFDLNKLLIEGAEIAFKKNSAGQGKVEECFVFRNFDAEGEWSEKARESYLDFIEMLARLRATPVEFSPTTPDRLAFAVDDAEGLKEVLKRRGNSYDIRFNGGDTVHISPKVAVKKTTGAVKRSRIGVRIDSLTDSGEDDTIRRRCTSKDIDIVEAWLKTPESEQNSFAEGGIVHVDYRLQLSSAEGAFFALGEMANESLAKDKIADERRYFKVVSDGNPPQGAVRTEMDGQAYWIDVENRRSISMFSLARQLFSLSTKAPTDGVFTRQRIILQQ